MHDVHEKTEFDLNVYTPLIRSFHDYFLANRDKKTMQIPQESADIYLKGLQKSQQEAATVDPSTYLFYSIVGKRHLKT